MADVDVSGPVTGGLHGRPFTAAVVDLDAARYVEEEFFLSGTAVRYTAAAAGTLGRDGRWAVDPDGAAVPFRTRLLVRRPVDASACNGTVVVEWQNVSGGMDIDAHWLHNYQEILRSGYAWVGVSAQRAGV